MRRVLIGTLLLATVLALAAPVLAGGFATVRLDGPPGDVVAGAPSRFGFTVRQHDVTPINDVTPILHARNVETGAEITAAAHQEGPVGHFVVEVTFPRSGAWKWSIEPQPFTETSFETLMVMDSSDTTSAFLQATIHTGACDALGAVAYDLGEITPQATSVESTRTPLFLGAATIDASLTQLVASGHAIRVASNGASDPTACGNIAEASGEPPADQAELVLGLQGSDSSRNVGIAVLRPLGSRTAVALYLLDSGALDTGAPTGTTKSVEIAGGETEDWSFQPATVTVAPGDTVIWTNTSDVAHTVTGDDLHFADSGLLDPGQTYKQTFTEPGTYSYHCGPHPWMSGVVVVK